MNCLSFPPKLATECDISISCFVISVFLRHFAKILIKVQDGEDDESKDYPWIVFG